MGGETGEGGTTSATLEILPRIPGGDTVMSLDWLSSTNPNNLYPFLHILPSGLIFVGSFGPLDFLPRIVVVDRQR